MAYKCAHCGKSHNQVDTAQDCANRNRIQGGYEGIMPDAHYLPVGQRDGQPVDVHVQLKTISGGVWGGYRLVNLYDDSGKARGIYLPADREQLLALVRLGVSGQGGFRRTMRRYGQVTAFCPICDERMYDEKELKSGVHSARTECYQTAFG